MISWYEQGNDCLRCSKGGVIPVMEFRKVGGRMTLYETIYDCGCRFSKPRYWWEEKTGSDKDGKRVTNMVRVRLSEDFDSKFSNTQFPFSPAIINKYRAFEMDYPTIYLAFMHKNAKLFHDTGTPQIYTGMDVFNDIPVHPVSVAGNL